MLNYYYKRSLAWMPLEHLAYWLKGQPAMNADYQVGTNHLLGAFTYHVDGSQWTADYLTYHSNNSMPENILLKMTAQNKP